FPTRRSSDLGITAQNTAFLDGQVTVGLGSDDIIVQRVWVLGPTRVQANVSVGANAVTGNTEVSLISGFEVLAQSNGFQVLPPNPSLPVIPAVRKDVIRVYVCGMDPTVLANPGRLQVTINGQPMPVQPLTPPSDGQTQIVFSLTPGFGPGQVNLAVVVDGSSSAPSPLTVR